MGRDHKAGRTNQMRCGPHPDVTLGQCRAQTRKRPSLQYGKITLDQSASGGRGGAADVALLEQDDPEVAPSGVARDADAIQTTADDRKIVVRHTLAIAFSGGACPVADAGAV